MALILKLKMICSVKMDGGNGNSTVFRCDGDEVFAMERRVPAGTLALQHSIRCRK